MSFLLKQIYRYECKLCFRASVLWAAHRAMAAQARRALTLLFCYGTGRQPYWLKYFWTSLLNVQVDSDASVPKNLKPNAPRLKSLHPMSERKKRQVRVEKEGPPLPGDRRRERRGRLRFALLRARTIRALPNASLLYGCLVGCTAGCELRDRRLDGPRAESWGNT